MRRRLFFNILLSLCTVPLPGQHAQYVFRHLTVEDGLSQNSAISVVQDSFGYLWAATQDGLNRYDGYDFKVYEKQFTDITRPTFSHLGQLFVGADGALWIIPKSGVPEKFDHSTATFQPLKGIEKASCGTAIASGELYFGTRGNGILKKNPDSDVLTHLSLPQPGTAVYSLLLDTNADLWAACDGNLYFLEKEKTEGFREAEIIGEIPGTNFSSLAEDGDGNLWAGTFGAGLFVKKRGSSAFEPFRGFSENNSDTTLHTLNILSVFCGKKGEIWLGTYGQGALLIDRAHQVVRQFRPQKNNPKAIAYNDILSIYEDRSGVVWFGTDGGGLSFLDPNLFKFNGFANYQVPDHVQIDVVRALLVDRNGKHWIGTSGNGLVVYDPKAKKQEWAAFRHEPANPGSLASNRVMALHEDRMGNVWIGTQGGGLDVFMSAEKRLRHFPQGEGPFNLNDNTVWDIHEDADGSLWLATQNTGLCHFSLENGLLGCFGKSPGGLPDNNVRVIHPGPKPGQLWLGMEAHGLCLFDKKTGRAQVFRHQPAEENSLASDNVKCLFADGETLWIGTNGHGLDAYQTATGRFRNFTKKEGLPNNVIYGILPDGEGGLWLSTNFGLAHFRPPADLSDGAAFPSTDHFGKDSGLQSFEFNTGAHFQASDGTLYFGGIQGYNWFDPKNVQKNIQPTEVILSQLEVQGEVWRGKVAVERLRELQLRHDENNLAFTFSTTNLSLPHQNRFRYQLVGYDEELKAAAGRNFVEYANLSPSDYLLRVFATNTDGIWNGQPKEIRIRIAPPWYRTWWAILLFLLFAGWLAYLLYQRWRFRWQLRLEKKEAEHLREMDAFKSRFFANITHEFRTPLTLILGPARQVQKRIGAMGKEEIKSLFSTIEQNGELLLEKVNQLLDLNKIEAGMMPDCQFVQADVVPFLKYLVESFHSYAESKKIMLSFHAEPESMLMDYDREKWQAIFSNLLSNALKYTPAGGTVSLSFFANQAEETVEVRVRDTGIGIPGKKLKLVFNRFYQVGEKNTAAAIGTGIGLALVREYVRLLGGRVSVESTVGVGSVFRVVLPVTIEAPLAGNIQLPASLPRFENTTVQGAQLQGDQPLVLIIEDQTEVSRFIGKCLEKDCRLAFAADGEEGLEKAAQFIPDFILSDVMMPGMSGLEVCQKLKTDELTLHIPVVLLTAKAGTEARIEGLKAGADAYLTKPFDEEELLVRIEELVGLRERLRQKFSTSETVDGEKTADDFFTSEDPFLQKVNALIHAHLDDDALNADLLSAELFYSKMQVYRKIKALTNYSTANYIRTYRLHRSRELLRSGQFNVSEVAWRAGFKSLSYFSSSFKGAFGVSPQQFQENA